MLLISFVLCTAAFTKMITINGQEYHLQLVDTAGQVAVSVDKVVFSCTVGFFCCFFFRGIALFSSFAAKYCRLTSSSLCLSPGWVLHLPTDLLHRHQRLHPGLFSHIKQKVLSRESTQILSDIQAIPAAVQWALSSSLSASKSYKWSMKSCWTWWERSSKYLSVRHWRRRWTCCHLSDKVVSPPLLQSTNYACREQERPTYGTVRSHRRRSIYSQCSVNRPISLLGLVVCW